VFHIRNTLGLSAGGGVSYTEHPGPFGEGGCFIYGTPQAFWRGGCFIYGTPWAFRRGEVFHIIYGTPRAFRRGGVFHIRNTRAFWRGGCFIYGTPQASWRGEVFHIRNTRIFRRGHRVSPAKRPGPERQTAAGSATTLLPPCALRCFPTGSPSAPSGAFPRDLPRLILGFPRGSSPRRRTR